MRRGAHADKATVMRQRHLSWILLLSGPLLGASSPKVLPMTITQYKSSHHPLAAYSGQSSAMSVFFEPTRTVYRMGGEELSLSFLKTPGFSRIEGQAGSGVANYLMGSRDNWITGLPVLAAVAAYDIYPGVDVVYHPSGSGLETEFRLSTADALHALRIRCDGATLTLALDGSVAISFTGGTLRLSAPRGSQGRGVDLVRVNAKYVIENNTLGLWVNHTDQQRPISISMTTLSGGSVISGSRNDIPTSISVEPSGSVYIAGFTTSPDLKALNATQPYRVGGEEAFIAKLEDGGTSLVYCTYIGGSGDDRANGIAVDAFGAAYVVGSTTSRDFPANHAVQPKLLGTANAFALKLAPAGNDLEFSTYLGGSGKDAAKAVALGPGGEIYLGGDTTSADLAVKGSLASYHGGSDGFLISLSAQGTEVSSAMYVGGSGDDHVNAIAVDNTGAIVLTGSTSSPDLDVSSAAQRTLHGTQDVFIAKFTGDGKTIFRTYLGGSDETSAGVEAGTSIAVDPAGFIYVTGSTASSDFPTLNALQGTLAGGQDAFIAKLAPNGALVYSTYVGGPGWDIAYGIAVGSDLCPVIAGQTTSATLAAATTGVTTAPEDTMFILKLKTTGSAIASLSTIGSSGNDAAVAIALNTSDTIYVTGIVQSPKIPIVSAFQLFGGDCSAFVAQVVLDEAVERVIVFPASAVLHAGEARQFTAVAQNSKIRLVKWSVIPALGWVSDTGLYLTPGNLSYPVKVNITATDIADPAISATAEVTIYPSGWRDTGGNLALNSPAAQSSSEAAATLAVDGSTDGDYLDGSVSLTTEELNPWWEIDLGSSHPIAAVTIWRRTDAGATTVNELALVVSDMPFTGKDTPSSLQQRSNTWVAPVRLGELPYTTIPVGYHGRFVRLQMSGKGRLALAEVQVFGTSNGISISPPAVRLDALGTQQFAVQMNGIDATDVVSWSVNPPIGTVTANGIYTAPLAGPAVPDRVVVSATVTSDPKTVAAAVVDLIRFTTPPNLAVGKSAAQSSTSGIGAMAAVDGNTDGDYFKNSVSQTESQTNPWWEVDLGAMATIQEVSIWNRADCCPGRLSDYWIFVSSSPFSRTESISDLANRRDVWASHQTSPPNPSVNIAVGRHGRYIRIQLSATGILNLAEVQVWGAWSNDNVALGKSAFQSTTWSPAARAVDGNVDGEYFDGSVSQTAAEPMPWWQVDLGAAAAIQSIAIWNRTDCCADRLDDYWIFVSNREFNAADTLSSLVQRNDVWNNHQTVAPDPLRWVSVGAAGRYVRIQLNRIEHLSLAEVEIFQKTR
jgi:hypothetical protein